MTFRTKLLLAQAPLGIVLALVCALSVVMVSSLGTHSQTILTDNYRSVLAAQRMKESLERLDSAALFLLAGQPDKGRRQTATHEPLFEAELQVQEGNVTERGEKGATERLRALWTNYQHKFTQLQIIVDPEAAKQWYFTELEPAFYAVKTTADGLLALNQDAMVRKSAEVRRAAERMTMLIIAAAVGALALGLFFSLILTNRLLRPLAVLSQATRRLGAGDFATRAHLHGHDEFAQLAKDFNAMADHLHAYRNSSLGELLQTQQAAQAAIDSLPDPVVIFGVAGDVRNVNRVAETLLGLVLEPDALNPLGAINPTVRATLERLCAHVLGGKGPYLPKGFEEAIRVLSDEGDKYLLPRATPVYDPRGGIIGATIGLHDVTRLRRFDELKNDLVATVAHEFRTPLTSLRMAIHLALEQVVGPVTEKQADLLHTAREDCERLQAMVDDLLDLSRIEAGGIEMHPCAMNAAALVQAAIADYRVAAAERGVQLSTHLSFAEEEVLADPERIGLVFSNLLTNALRYTPQGGIIAVRARPIEGAVRFEVADTGTGIPQEYQEHVFDKFFRIPGSASNGVGLGLSIVKEIVHGHAGEVGLESQAGHGSTFWFTLPRTRAQHT